MIRLNETELEKNYKVVKICSDDAIKRRFLDIGIVPEARIKKVLICPFGGISAYFIMGATIAIRDNDARGILVVSNEEV